MEYCISCKKIKQYCGCIRPQIVNNITSNAAGNDGLDAMRIAQLTGEFTGTTYEQFVAWNKGPKGDKGDSQVYTNADW